MWKVIVTVAILGFAGIQAQEFCIQCSSRNTTDCVFPDLLERFNQVCNESSGFCFTRVNPDGTIDRGCGSNTDVDCDTELCRRCALISGGSTACNDDVLPIDRLTCYVCSGDRNSTCGQISRNTTVDIQLHRTICPLFRNEDQCVATRIGGTVQRGCLSSMQSVNCGVTHNCCLGHGCNNFEWDALNGAYSIHSVMKVITIALFGAILGYNNL